MESSNPGQARPSRLFSGRGVFIALFALLIAGSAALVVTGAAGAGSADGASAAPTSAGAAPVSGPPS